MRDRVAVGVRGLRLDGSTAVVSASSLKSHAGVPSAPVAGSALDEAKLLVEVNVVARDEALCLEVVEQEVHGFWSSG